MAWSLKKIIKTREEAVQMMSFEVGNGEGILFWHDPWLENKLIILKEEFKAIKSRIKSTWLKCSIKDIKTGKCNALLKSIPEGARILNLIKSMQFNDNADKKRWEAEVGGKYVTGKA